MTRDRRRMSEETHLERRAFQIAVMLRELVRETREGRNEVPQDLKVLRHYLRTIRERTKQLEAAVDRQARGR